MPPYIKGGFSPLPKQKKRGRGSEKVRRAEAMNAPDRYERFVVPEGTKKVSYERDTKIINAASFIIEREEHTIGNIRRMQLHLDENALFAGYKLPHPLQYKIIIRWKRRLLIT
ncbi:unnamed protein product [Linum tenue]|uniref:DNA-directed RNA polymerase RBP11-like dimerisation domain-containing protein n=1 Tax=Linum tenue TaxID=586396 RepID=A0AAV0I7N2_9ROSI|nr:unnamed protein product [Linum tenue]